MFWIIAIVGWLVVAPVIGLVLGTAVALADRAAPSRTPAEATDPEPCPATSDATETQEELASAG